MKTYKNILVSALVNLGDVILTTSAIALLKKAYPEARITMLVKHVCLEAVEDHPLIDEVISFGYKAKETSFKQMLAMRHELASRHFDLYVSFDRKLRPALLAFLAGIPARIGGDRLFDDKSSRVTWLYTDTIHIAHHLENTLQAETYQAVVRGFTGIAEHERPVFSSLREVHIERAKSLVARLPPKEKIIALCVKGTFPLKTWPKEYFAKVVDTLSKEYEASFFVVGAPNDREYADEVLSLFSVPCENFCGETGLRDLAAVFLLSDLFITVDTGATHIAATTHVPMVTIYGCTSPRRWHPYSEHAEVLTANKDCCPCSYRAEECPYHPAPACLYEIMPEMVLEKARKLLRG